MKSKTSNRGPQKTTREDWVDAALSLLISDGIECVKVQRISKILNCPRSSFYWFFSKKSDLLDELLSIWTNTNSNALVERAGRKAPSINAAAMNVFCCWVNDDLFHPGLDFKIREWSTRDKKVRILVEKADDDRITAISEMFLRYGYDHDEALVRSRILYFTQIGYFVLNMKEGAGARARLSPQYVFCHTGQFPTENEMQALYDAFDRVV